MSIRVALLPEHFNWGGGFDFLRHIVNGLSSVAISYDISISIAVKSALLETENYKQFEDYLSQTSELAIPSFTYETCQSDLVNKLREHQIDIVLPVNSDLGHNFPIPWVAYLPDFQHRYLHTNFSEHECFQRETAFVARLRDCKTMLVNSKAVRNDILNLYPWVDGDRIFSLPFTPHPQPHWFALNSAETREKYQIDKNYFILCNQFWIHKDHATAFKALAQLSECDVQLVCTGSPDDYRRPDYFKQLIALTEQLGIVDRLLLLGHIPKADQIALLKDALALIQPTLFEGGPGGGAAYDAVSLGVPVILSDIKINQEVQADNCQFFAASNADELAKTMKHYLSPTTAHSKESLIENGMLNQKKLGDALYSIIDETLNRFNKQNN